MIEDPLRIRDSLLHTSHQSDPIINPPKPRLHEQKWRICNILLYVTLSGLCDLQFFGLSLVMTQIYQLYGVSLTLSFWYSSAFLICPILFSLPAGIFTSNRSIKLTLGVATGITLLGSWIKVLINQSFFFSILGQFVVASAYPFFKNGFTKMSSQWFNVSNRTIATSFLNATGEVINILSMYLPTLAINANDIPPHQTNLYKDRLQTLYLVYAGLATGVGVLCLLFYKELPSQPVSQISSIQRLTIQESFSYLRLNKSLLFPILAASLVGGVVVSYEVIIEPAFRNYGSNTLTIRDYTLLSAPFMFFFSISISFISGYCGSFRKILIISNFIPLTCLIVLIFYYEGSHPALIGLTFVLASVSFTGQSSIGIEYLSEICFPVPEPFVIGLTLFSLKICCLLMVQLSSLLIQSNHLTFLLFIFIVALIISTICLYLSKEKLNRRQLDEI